MKSISTKGLIVRMLGALVAVVVIMSMKPARAGEVFYPGNLSRVEMQGDHLAQMYKAQMPLPPTQQQAIDAQRRVMERAEALNAKKAVQTQLSTDSIDAVGNNRPNAHFDNTPSNAPTTEGFKY